jgi:hypothetical protein
MGPRGTRRNAYRRVPAGDRRDAVDDNVGGIEQHDQVLREIDDCVDAQIGVAEQHRAGLGDAKRRANNREMDRRNSTA